MRKILTALLIFAFTFLTLSVTKVSAKTITNENGNVNIGKTEIINDDLFIGAQTVQIDGTVNGDVFIGAQSVKVSGIINGSLHVGANTLDLDGVVKGNVYAGAQNILVNGSSIGGSLLVGAASVSIDKNSSVGGSILAGAGTLSINSQVKRSVYAGTGSLQIGSDTVIGKDLYYAEGNQGQVNISEKAKIAGSVYKSETITAQKSADMKAAKKQTSPFINGAKVMTGIISLAGALIVGLLYMKLFGQHLAQTSDLVSKSFWKVLGVGFLVTIAAVPGLIILLITVIGIPLAGLALLTLLIFSYLAKIVVASAFGNWAKQKYNWTMSNFGSLALGLAAFYVIKQIPFIGFLAGLVVLWLGLGALTLKIFSKSE